jgi:hypothetical protein
MNTKLKNHSIDYGTKLGGFLAFSSLLFYILDPLLFINLWIGAAFVILIVSFGAFSSYKSRNLFEDKLLNWKNSFKVYFITIAVGYLIGNITLFIIFNIIDPDIVKIIFEKSLELSEQIMIYFGTPEERIATELEKAKKIGSENLFSLKALSKDYFYKLAIFSLIGTMISLITKSSN